MQLKTEQTLINNHSSPTHPLILWHGLVYPKSIIDNEIKQIEIGIWYGNKQHFAMPITFQLYCKQKLEKMMLYYQKHDPSRLKYLRLEFTLLYSPATHFWVIAIPDLHDEFLRYRGAEICLGRLNRAETHLEKEYIHPRTHVHLSYKDLPYIFKEQ